MTCVDLAMIWMSLLPNWTGSDARAFDNQTKMILFKSTKTFTPHATTKNLPSIQVLQWSWLFFKYFIFKSLFYSEYIFLVLSFIFQDFILNWCFLLSKTVRILFKNILWINLTFAMCSKYIRFDNLSLTKT